MTGGSPPLVGLLTTTESIDGVAHHAVRDVYVRALTDVAKVDVVLLPVGPAARLDRLDGVVLGGHQSNVEPEQYGAANWPEDLLDPPRDRTAVAAVRAAVSAGIPLLGVCRGLQEINVAFGGTLRVLEGEAHREDAGSTRDEQYLPAHPIAIRPDGVLHRVLGRTTVSVNSLHGQAVDVVAPGLRVEATAPPGVVEALSVHGSAAFALGVQWHPEWYAGTDPSSRAIFEAFRRRLPPDRTTGELMTWSLRATTPETTTSSSLFDSVGWLRTWESVGIERRDRHVYVTTDDAEVLPLYRTSHSPFWFGYEAQSGIAPLSEHPIVFAGSTYSMYTKRGAVPSGLVRGAYSTAMSWIEEGGLLVVPNVTEEGAESWQREAGAPVGRILLDRTYHCDVAASLDDHLGRLPNKLRRDVQRRMRRSEERGMRFRVIDGAEAAALIPDTLPLTVGTTDEHAWPPLYDEPTLTTLLTVPGAVLAVAQVDGELVGTFFGFVHGDEVTFLCGGVDYTRLTELSTYVVLMYGCTRWACEQGLKRIEWGRDNYRFKQRHGLDSTDLWALVYSREPGPGLAERLAHMNGVLSAYIERG